MRKIRLGFVVGLLVLSVLLAAGTAAAGGWLALVALWQGSDWGAGETQSPIQIEEGVTLIRVPNGLDKMAPRSSEVIGQQTVALENPTDRPYLMVFWPEVNGVSGGTPNIQLMISENNVIILGWQEYRLLKIPAGFQGDLQFTLRVAPWGSAGEAWEELHIKSVTLYDRNVEETAEVATTGEIVVVPPEQIGDGTYRVPKIEVDGTKIYPD